MYLKLTENYINSKYVGLLLLLETGSRSHALIKNFMKIISLSRTIVGSLRSQNISEERKH